MILSAVSVSSNIILIAFEQEVTYHLWLHNKEISVSFFVFKIHPQCLEMANLILIYVQIAYAYESIAKITINLHSRSKICKCVKTPISIWVHVNGALSFLNIMIILY